MIDSALHGVLIKLSDKIIDYPSSINAGAGADFYQEILRSINHLDSLLSGMSAQTNYTAAAHHHTQSNARPVTVMTSSDVMRALGLNKHGYSAIIAAIAAGRGQVVAADVIALQSGYNTSSLPVMISHVRKALCARGASVTIKAAHGQGYFISLKDVMWIEGQIRAQMSAPDMLAAAPDEAVRICKELLIPERLQTLFVMLMHHTGAIVSYEDLARAHGCAANSLITYICHLRQALSAVGYPQIIETISKLGYRISSDSYQLMRQAILCSSDTGLNIEINR